MSEKSPLGIGQIKYGALLSYILIVVNALQGMFLAPYILAQIGDSNYGVYKTIAAFSATLMVLDLGIGTTVMRYTAKFRAENKPDEIANFAAMGLIEAAITAVVVGGLSIGIYIYLPTFYADSFTANEIALAQTLFFILAVNMVLVIFENVLNGVITGSNRFVFANGIKLGLLILRIFASVALLQRWKSAVILVALTLVCSVVTMIAQIYYIRVKLHISIRLHRWDFRLFKESLGYTALMFVQTIAVQVNSNVDNIVISRVIGPIAVAVYSFGIQLFTMYESLATAFSNLMLPHVSKRIGEGADSTALQQIVVKVGRMQFVVLGAALVGFAILGKDFIGLWLGRGYEDVYVITLILMIPSLLELCVNVCLSVLRAKNMLGFRTAVLAGSTALNAIITVVGVSLCGYMMAAVGTAVSFTVGSLIIMNIYYYKKMSFRMLCVYREIFRGTWICLLLAGGATFISSQWLLTEGWLAFVVNVMIFVVVYMVALLLFGLNKNEKGSLPVLNKLWK